MRTFLQKKLWRDKMLDKCESQGSRLSWRVLSDQEYDKELRTKLIEEAQEVRDATSHQDLIEELADVFEVIDSLCRLHQIERAQIINAQEKKREERGGFAGRKYVEYAKHPRGSFLEKYCLDDSTKYPELPIFGGEDAQDLT